MWNLLVQKFKFRILGRVSQRLLPIIVEARLLRNGALLGFGLVSGCRDLLGKIHIILTPVHLIVDCGSIDFFNTLLPLLNGALTVVYLKQTLS